MGVLDAYLDEINAYFSEWIKVNDKNSGWTIEDFPYKTGVDEDLTKPHCWKCVTVNNCWFKNEIEKKPEHFDYSNYTYSEIAKSRRGLYHPNCHCKEKAINVPREKDIEIMMTAGKVNDFFDEKLKWFYSWGYLKSDKNDFIKAITEKTIKSYRQGRYEQEKHTKYGFQINITVEIDGVREKSGKTYSINTCYIVFPSGKIRCVTLVGGKNYEDL